MKTAAKRKKKQTEHPALARLTKAPLMMTLKELAWVLGIAERTMTTSEHRREILERVAVLPRGIQKRYSKTRLIELLNGEFWKRK